MLGKIIQKFVPYVFIHHYLLTNEKQDFIIKICYQTHLQPPQTLMVQNVRNRWFFAHHMKYDIANIWLVYVGCTLLFNLPSQQTIKEKG